MLCGCETLKPAREGQPKSLAVAIPDTCEKILQEVELARIDEHTDARVAFVMADGVGIEANGRIGAGRRCIAKVRQGLAAADSKRKGDP